MLYRKIYLHSIRVFKSSPKYYKILQIATSLLPDNQSEQLEVIDLMTLGFMNEQQAPNWSKVIHENKDGRCHK